MKRWLVRICVFLIFGAIVNVVVTWASVLALTPEMLEHELEYFGHGGAHINTHPCWEQVILWGAPDSFRLSEFHPSLPKWVQPEPDDAAEQSAVVYQVLDARGWPALSMRSGYQSVRPVGGPGEARVLHGIALEPTPDFDFRIGMFSLIPTVPIWPGFAINTVFYGVIVWLLFAGPFVLRRWRRIRRGLCPKCAYDLRGTPSDATACPECGEAVPSLHFGQR